MEDAAHYDLDIEQQSLLMLTQRVRERFEQAGPLLPDVDLTNLTLNEANFFKFVVPELIQHSAASVTWHRLLLAHNGLSFPACNFLIEFLLKNCTNLEELSLANNNLGDQSMEILASFVNQAKTELSNVSRVCAVLSI